MKKTLMIAAAAVCFAAPAFAADGADVGKMVDYHLSKADANADGSVAKDEMLAYAEKCFTDADANADGMVSRDEMVAHKTKQHDEMMGEAAPAVEGEAAPAADAPAAEGEAH